MDISGNDGCQLIHDAAKAKNPEALKYLKSFLTPDEWTAQVNRKNRKEGSKTPLFYAMENKSYKAMKFLLECGADVDAKQLIDNRGNKRTCLQKASVDGDHVAAQVLAEGGANLNETFNILVKVSYRIVGNRFMTPLQAAIYRGHQEVVSTLVNAGASLKVRLNGNYLHELTLNKNCFLRDHYDPFLNALVSNQLEAFKDMVSKNKTWLQLPTENGRLALHIAAEQGHVAMVEFILEQEEDINIDAQDSAGNTALHLAALNTSKSKSTTMIKRLEEAGANALIKNKAGKTAAEQKVGRFGFGTNPMKAREKEKRKAKETRLSRFEDAIEEDDFNKVLDIMKEDKKDTQTSP